MTARISDLYAGFVEAPVSGTLLAREALDASETDCATIANTAGQLWERVAEMGEAGVVNSPNYSARIADAFRELSGNAAWRGMAGGSERGERVCSAIVDCGRHLCFAGTLTARDMRAWRVGAARPYTAQHVHTGFECGAL